MQLLFPIRYRRPSDSDIYIKGDSLYSIAMQFGVSVDDLIQANQLTKYSFTN